MKSDMPEDITITVPGAHRIPTADALAQAILIQERQLAQRIARGIRTTEAREISQQQTENIAHLRALAAQLRDG